MAVKVRRPKSRARVQSLKPKVRGLRALGKGGEGEKSASHIRQQQWPSIV